MSSAPDASSVSDQSTNPNDQPSALVARLQRIFPWFRRGGMAILDQGFSNGANFIMHIFMARWLMPEAYGAFVIAFTFFLLLLSLYNSIVVEPVAIYGAGKYEQDFQRYFGILITRAHVIGASITAGILILAGIGCWYAERPLLTESFIMLGLIAPVWQMCWLTRQPCYVVLKPRWAALSSLIYAVLLIGLLIFLGITDQFTIITALLAVAIASMGANITLIRLLKPHFRAGKSKIRTMQVFRDHFAYGKWSSVTWIVGWLQNNIFYLVLPFFVGLSGTASLRALINLITPIQRVLWALKIPLVPEFVSKMKKSGKSGLTSIMRKLIMIQIILGIGYAIMLVLFGEWVVNLVYDGRYTEYLTPNILFIIGLIPIFAGTTSALLAAYSAMGRVDLGFKTSLVGGILTLVIGISATAQYGIEGSLVGWLLASVLTVIVMLIIYRRGEPKEL